MNGMISFVLLSDLFLVKTFPGFLYFFIGNIVVIVHHFVDYTIRSKFYDPVTYRFNKFVVMRRQQDISFKRAQRIVKCLNGFQVKMIGR